MSKSTCDWVTHQLWWSARSSLCERKNIAWMWHWPRTRPPLSTTSAAHRKHVHINDLYYHMCMYINLDTYKLQINMLYIYMQQYTELMNWLSSSIGSFFKSHRLLWHPLVLPSQTSNGSPSKSTGTDIHYFTLRQSARYPLFWKLWHLGTLAWRCWSIKTNNISATT